MAADPRPERIHIKNLGPLADAVFEPRRLTVLVGPQASGKSLVAQLLYLLRELPRQVACVYKPTTRASKGWGDDVLRALLDDLRGVPFGYFAGGRGTANIGYQGVADGRPRPWTLSIYRSNRRVHAGPRLARALDAWADAWDRDAVEQAHAQQLRQVFIPPERSAFTRLVNQNPGALYADYQPSVFRQFASALARAYPLYRSIVDSRRREPLDDVARFVLACQQRALGAHLYVPAHGPQVWKLRIPRDRAKPLVLPVEAAASGQMEAAPFFVLAATLGGAGHAADFYFEEPETHLHPAAQLEVLRVVAFLVGLGRRFVITTHSPYILLGLNNLMQRHNSGVADGEPALDPDLVAAYRLRSHGPPSPILDPDTRLIDAEELERVALDLGSEFERLLERAEANA